MTIMRLSRFSPRSHNYVDLALFLLLRKIHIGCASFFLRNFKVAEAQCCKAVIMACQMDEDMTPLTAEQSKQKISKSEQFSAMGRKETQPFLDSISKVNPVPNITL